MESAAWERAEHVLCVRLDGIGDVLMSTPAIRALKQARQGRRLTLLTSPAGAEVARLVPEIDAVLTYEAPWMKSTASGTNSMPDRACIEQVRSLHCDGGVIFTVYSQSALPAAFLCYLADIPLRLAHCRENPYRLLTDFVPESEPERGVRHEVRRQLDLVATAGCRTDANEQLSLRVPLAARMRVQTLLRELGITQQAPWAVIHPGASAPSRRYPPAAFAEVARRLSTDHGWQIVLTGGAPEANLADSVRGNLPARCVQSLAGRLSLAELAALLAVAPVVITNNTGSAHMAAALQRPVVVLYALTNPQHTPWCTPSRVLFHDVPCHTCYKSVCPEGHHNCLALVSPGEVVSAALELAGQAGPVLPATLAVAGGNG